MAASAIAERQKRGQAPPVTTNQSTAKFKLYSEEISAIQAVVLAASTDDMRGTLVGVRFVGNGSELAITATDGYRLHHAVIPTDQTFDAIVPARWLATSITGVKPLAKIPTELSIADGVVSITNGQETRSIKLVNGDYPKHQTIINAHEEAAAVEPGTELMVNPRYFSDAMKACELFVGDGVQGARFKVTGDKKPLSYTVRAGSRSLLALLMPLRIA